jgi:hypothetical protein
MPIMTKNSPPDDSQFVRSQIGAIPAFLSTGKGTKNWKPSDRARREFGNAHCAGRCLRTRRQAAHSFQKVP